MQQAISAVLQPNSPEPTIELRTRIKRLLETDRSLGRAPRARDPERANYAFYSADAPGSGVEVWFSGYAAFALLQGLILLYSRLAQSFAVDVMRRREVYRVAHRPNFSAKLCLLLARKAHRSVFVVGGVYYYEAARRP